MQIAVTEVSTKGQIVIPSDIKRRLKIREGEKLLMLAADDAIVLRKVSSKTFAQLTKPIWQAARQLGLSEADVDAIIQEAKARSRPR